MKSPLTVAAGTAYDGYGLVRVRSIVANAQCPGLGSGTGERPGSAPEGETVRRQAE